ncbi:hypothetical protein BHE74_00023802 [Ensete ventricosum]|uniref:Uncharacterized protein n=1 Tax=Ensete ventricosum TaxID=4639 RepID=A0A427AZF3_ENSVE|nr:hypothetical protein B296_00021663 [Ensete ventricosum]RWW10136.1 hypothetical protein GW17_00026331 [Ensete ventricosum]RWW68663.1 hypothetical protein BHE74_00023802 [Ensete ventricosum]RZS01050.1 hypothetical protein BHM03_00030849 [Ensete ventricosum]
MGISFRLSKSGKRFRPKPILVQEETGPSGGESKESSGVHVGAGSKREVRLFVLLRFGRCLLIILLFLVKIG